MSDGFTRYNNCHGNIVYSRLHRRSSEIIISITVSGTSVDQRNIEQYIGMMLRVIFHTVHIMKNKAHTS